MSDVIPTEQIERHILLLRGQKVILDADLARLYGVPTYRFNEAFKRNRHRFPDDFAFQLTAGEFADLRSNMRPQACKAPTNQEIRRTHRNLR